MAVNTVLLQGRLTKDVELRTTQSGISVASFTIAVNKPFNKDHEHPEADFFDCVAWRTTAEFLSKYFSKGKPLIVEGSLQTRSYEDKEGNKRKVVEVVASNIHFVESKKDADTGQQTANANHSSAVADLSSDPENELPF